MVAAASPTARPDERLKTCDEVFAAQVAKLSGLAVDQGAEPIPLDFPPVVVARQLFAIHYQQMIARRAQLAAQGLVFANWLVNLQTELQAKRLLSNLTLAYCHRHR